MFTRSGSTWTEEALTAGGRLAGSTVALSADGTTALVGGSGREPQRGTFVPEVSMFTRAGTTWTRQANFTFAPTTWERPQTGLALSADGDVALVGEVGATGSPPRRERRSGRALIFTRSGSEWTPRGEPLIPSGEVGEAEFGSSVALSGDGDTALIGAPNDNGVGAAWVFTDSASGWTQDGEKITAAGAAVSFGKSVALSSDGQTALIGAGKRTTGAAFLFKRTGPTWTQQGAGSLCRL